MKDFSKEQIGYKQRAPSCSSCKYEYFSAVARCALLAPEDTIEHDAICDMYAEETKIERH
jgi:hypothetical protein